MHHRVPVFGGHGRERAVARDAGVADHAIVSAVRLHIGLQRRARGVTVGHVEHQHAGLSAQRLDVGDHRLCFLDAAAAMHHHIETIARDAQRDGAADAPAGAGHQHGQIPCHASPLSR
ncbi:hypothetical protein D3C71_1314110 [compost metagenome]